MSNLLSLDPGLDAPALAGFRNGVLNFTRAIRVPSKYRRADFAERARAIANLIVGEIPDDFEPSCFVYERMEIYSNRGRRGSGTRARPDDLLKVATLAGYVAGRLNVPSSSHYPKIWLGGASAKNHDEPWKSTRGAIAKAVLSRAEFALVEDCTHDELDAVCIGLFELDRFKAQRVYPGAV